MTVKLFVNFWGSFNRLKLFTDIGSKIRLFLAVVAFLVHTIVIHAADSSKTTQQKKNQTATQTTSNEQPNTSSRFKPDSTNFSVFADLLLWLAEESGTENWAEVITGGAPSPEICIIRKVNFNWDPGFRVGLSYGMKHDQWSTQLYYTRFHTRGKDRVTSSPGSVFSAFLGNFYVDNPTGAGIKGLAYERANIHWTIDFNIFDWELGRSFWISKALSIRPFLGLKGGWIHQSIHSKWQHPSPPEPPQTFIPFDTGRERLKNNFWGLGPSGGLDMDWNVYSTRNNFLSLFGNFSGAILYGHWTFKDVYTNEIPQKILVKLPRLNSGASMLRTVMGLGWDTYFKQGQYHFSTKLGYEMQFWLDQLQYYTLDTGRLGNALTLQGGTLEFWFDF